MHIAIQVPAVRRNPCLHNVCVTRRLTLPQYALIGLSEIFASVTGLEYAYTKAPPSMKSFVQSMYLLTTAFGSALGMALTPVAYDPAVLWLFGGLAIATFVAGCVVWILFHHLNATEDEMNFMDDNLEDVGEEQLHEGYRKGSKEAC